MKVLVVDDSPSILLSMTKILVNMRSEDMTVLTARSAPEAMDAFHREEPDVVFMDMEMPPENGDAAAKQMLSVRPDVKLIVMTGLAPDDDRVRRLVSAGAYDIIEKPIRVERLEQLFLTMDAESRRLRRVR